MNGGGFLWLWCGVWAGDSRAAQILRRSARGSRHIDTPGRELLAVCKQYLEVLSSAQTDFFCHVLSVSAAGLICVKRKNGKNCPDSDFTRTAGERAPDREPALDTRESIK